MNKRIRYIVGIIMLLLTILFASILPMYFWIVSVDMTQIEVIQEHWWCLPSAIFCALGATIIPDKD